MIVDNHAMKILSAACRMFDIIEENVSLVENLDLKRQPILSNEAIYFVSPRSDSVDKIIADFADQQSQMYLCAHIFFHFCPSFR